MGSGKLKGFLFTLAGFALIVGLFFLCMAIMKNNASDYEKEKIPYEQELQSATEEARKLDPEGNKIVLTERLLKAEYRLTYESTKAGANTFSKIATIILIVMGAFCIISIASMIIRARRREEPLRIYNLVLAFIPLIFVGIFFFITKSFTSMSKYPKPEEAGYKIYTINVVDRKSETHSSTDSDGQSRETTTYYIYYEGQNGTKKELSVNLSLYNAASRPGYYHLVSATNGNKFIYFGLYSTDEYIKQD